MKKRSLSVNPTPTRDDDLADLFNDHYQNMRAVNPDAWVTREFLISDVEWATLQLTLVPCQPQILRPHRTDVYRSAAACLRLMKKAQMPARDPLIWAYGHGPIERGPLGSRVAGLSIPAFIGGYQDGELAYGKAVCVHLEKRSTLYGLRLTVETESGNLIGLDGERRARLWALHCRRVDGRA